MFEQSSPIYGGMNFKQVFVVVLMNIFLLAELAFSIYLGSRDRDNMTVVFLEVFIPMVIATLVLARVLVKRMRDRGPSLIKTP